MIHCFLGREMVVWMAFRGQDRLSLDTIRFWDVFSRWFLVVVDSFETFNSNEHRIAALGMYLFVSW